MTNTNVRVGVIVDSHKVPNWTHQLIKSVIETPFTTLVAVFILKPRKLPGTGLGGFIKQKWDRYDGRKLRPKAAALKRLDTLDHSAEISQVSIDLNNDCFQFEAEDLNKTESYQLDVVLNLNQWWPKGDLLALPRNGVWHFFFGDYQKRRYSMPYASHEFLTRQGYMGTCLLKLSKESLDHQVLFKSFSHVDQTSLNRTLQFSQWKCISFAMRKLKQLSQLGSAIFEERTIQDNRLIFGDLPPVTNGTLGLTLTQLKRTLHKKLRAKFITEDWILSFSQAPEPTTDFSKYRKIIPPKDRFWADPFLLFRNGKHYVFLEEVIKKKRKGHISVLEIDDKGNYSQPVKILSKPYHLSYPYLIEWEDELYMIPESSGNKTIDVYKCVEFPHRWEFHKTIMEGVEAVDATLFYYDTKWWLFANIKERPGYPNWDELFLFYSDEPFSTSWVSHPANPIISDVRSARPAGKIFRWGQKIYRPSQNCAHRYGYGMKFNQIVTLTETSYREIEVSSVDPLWDPQIKAIHTFNFEAGLSIIDAKLERFKF
jgi:hypothetical protein